MFATLWHSKKESSEKDSFMEAQALIVQNLPFFNYKGSIILGNENIFFFPCRFLRLNIENSKITIKTWPFPEASIKGSSWNSMCKKQRLCSLPIPGPQYYYTNKTLTKTYILQIKKKKKEESYVNAAIICQSLWKLYIKMGEGDVSLLPASLGPVFWQASNSTAKHKRRRDNKCFTTEAFLLCTRCQQKKRKIS